MPIETHFRPFIREALLSLLYVIERINFGVHRFRMSQRMDTEQPMLLALGTDSPMPDFLTDWLCQE